MGLFNANSQIAENTEVNTANFSKTWNNNYIKNFYGSRAV